MQLPQQQQQHQQLSSYGAPPAASPGPAHGGRSQPPHVRGAGGERRGGASGARPPHALAADWPLPPSLSFVARRLFLPRSRVSAELASAATARPAPDWVLSGRKVAEVLEDWEQAWAHVGNLILHAAPGLSSSEGTSSGRPFQEAGSCASKCSLHLHTLILRFCLPLNYSACFMLSITTTTFGQNQM